MRELRPPAPPPPPGPPPPLRAEIERDFGSVGDFARVLREMTSDPRRGGYVYLICTPDGRLRLVRLPAHAKPRGRVLMQFPVRPGPPPSPDWHGAGTRYAGHLRFRPPFPLP